MKRSNETDRKFNYFFFTLDILFSALLSVLCNNLSFILLILLGVADSYKRVNFMAVSERILVLSNVYRFVLFFLFFGFGRCQIYLTLSILYLQMVLSRSKSGTATFPRFITIPFFVIFNLFFHFFTFSSSLDLDTQRYINICIRLYVVASITMRIMLYKYFHILEERDLSEKAIRLSQKEEDELKFMRRFSHFSRTSLNGILNFSQFIQNAFSMKQRYQFLSESSSQEMGARMSVNDVFRTLENCCTLITRQSKDLSEYYLIQSEKYQVMVKKMKSKVRNVVEFVCLLQKKLQMDTDVLTKEKVTFEYDVHTSVPETILLDENRLIQILTNIVSNSLKYTNSGYVRLKVSLDAYDDNLLKFVCEDSGIGIAKDKIGKIFEPFVVTQSTNKPSFSIGLFITKTMVEKMGGSLVITSPGSGHGTTVHLDIPFDSIVEGDENEVSTSTDEEEKESELSERERRMSMNMKKMAMPKRTRFCDILLVEDSEINMTVFQRQVEILTSKAKGINIYTARDGIEALQFFNEWEERNKNNNNDNNSGKNPKESEEKNYPVVITDIDMPNLSGIGLCKELRKRYGMEIVIYAITATIIGSKSEFCKKYCFDGVKQKPITIGEMKKALSYMFKERSKRYKRSYKIDKDGDENTIYEPIDNNNNNGEKTRDSILSQLVGDLRITILVVMLDFMLIVVTPDYFKKRFPWVFLYTYFDYCAIVVQYFGFYVFGWSVETNNVMTSVRHLITVILAGEYGLYKLIQGMFLCYIGFIVHAANTVEKYSTSLFLIILWMIVIFYYELVRTSEYFTMMTYDSHIQFTNFLTVFFFVFNIIVISEETVTGVISRKKKLTEMIGAKEAIQGRHNLAMSKISHDLTSPASALGLYIREFGEYRKTELERISNKNKNNNNNNNGRNSGGVGEWFNLMCRCVVNLDLGIQNFLLCCKFKNQKIVTDLSEIDINDMIRKLVKNFSILENKRSTVNPLKIVLTNFEDKMRVKVDYSHVKVILSNMYVNALIHSRASTIEIRKEIFVDENNNDNNRIKIRVIDDGIGITNTEILSRLEKSNNNNNNNKNNIEDQFHFRETFSNTLGLGIVVNRILSRLIGGEIEINTKKFSGTEVVFSFPYSKVEEGDGVDNERNKKKRLFQNDSNFKMNRRDLELLELKKKKKEEIRILVVDDCKILIKFMKFYFSKLGIIRNAVFTTSDEEAIQHLRNERFDFLFIDYNLSTMNSIELLSRIDERQRPIVTAIVSGQGLNSDDFGDIKIDFLFPKPMGCDQIKMFLSTYVDFETSEDKTRRMSI